jgi:hypothetical protein
MSSYSSKTWKEFSRGVIELDNFKCTHCGRTEQETTLQVHHKKYIRGCKPWEYATRDCETVCKGCHSSIHGFTKPKFGWEYFGDEDLGDLIGTCENCGSSIRYVFTIHHENWGTLEVGTICCDNLTDSKVASNLMESNSKYVGRRRRFLNSIRWKEINGIQEIKQGNFLVKIMERENGYFINIHDLQSKIKYESLVDAKIKVFDVIESGELVQYIKKNNINIQEPKKRK